VDLITKATIILGVIFMVNSFFLASIFTHQFSKENKSVIQNYLEGEEVETKDSEAISNLLKQ
jgi:preprotein translocase subunit SecG